MRTSQERDLCRTDDVRWYVPSDGYGDLHRTTRTLLGFDFDRHWHTSMRVESLAARHKCVVTAVSDAAERSTASGRVRRPVDGHSHLG